MENMEIPHKNAGAWNQTHDLCNVRHTMLTNCLPSHITFFSFFFSLSKWRLFLWPNQINTVEFTNSLTSNGSTTNLKKNQSIHWKCRLLLENKLCAALKLLIYVNIDVVSSIGVIVFKLSKHLIVGVNISASMYLMICPSYDGLFFWNRMLHNFPARPPTCISMPYLSLYKIYSDHENVAGNNAGN